MCHCSRVVGRTDGTSIVGTASSTESGGRTATNARVTSAVAEAEFVALGVVHHDPLTAVLAEWLRADARRPELDEPLGLRFDVPDDQVEVHSVLH